MVEPARIASVPARRRVIGRSANILDMDVIQSPARLDKLKTDVSMLRHDVLSMLAPALLVADRLLTHPDPEVVKAGETTIEVVIKIKDRLLEMRLSRSGPNDES